MSSSEFSSVERQDFLHLVTRDGRKLENAPTIVFQNDGEIVLSTAKQYRGAFQYNASDELKGDPRFVQEMLEIDNCALQYASDTLKICHDGAHQQNGRAARSASKVSA